MTTQAAAFAELAEELLAAGRPGELLAQLGDPDLLPEWEDDAVVAAVATALGRHTAPGRFLDIATLRRTDCSLLLPVPGREASTARVFDGVVALHGVVRGELAATLAVDLEGAIHVLPAGAVSARAMGGFDPSAELSLVTATVATSSLEAADLSSGEITSRAARFVAHELVGVAEAALSLAGEHVRTRHQFGVPLGSFQAVRHRLAEAYVQLTAARELLLAVDSAAGVEIYTLVLKGTAGVAALSAVAAAQQVCGGMGFTEEFGLHRLVRRAYLLDSLLGGSEDADARLGALALAGRVIPDREVQSA